MTRQFDQDLLFAILAFQMDFVQREELIAATSSWLSDTSRRLEDVLVERGSMRSSDRELLSPLVVRHLENHDGDLQKALCPLSSIDSVADELRSLGDGQLEMTLTMVAKSPPRNEVNEAPSIDAAGGAGGRFRVLRPHAKGGLGEVSVAQDIEVNREVALKEILPRYAGDEQSRARFLLEAEITGGLEHPGVVPVYGLGRYEDGRPFYAMRFIKGDSLQDAVSRFHEVTGTVNYDSLQFRKLLGRFVDVCDAIQYAHSRGVLHRDLKPGNIMLGKYGETLVVDWGLAKAQEQQETDIGIGEATLRPQSASGSAATQMGSAIGTPAYMPPEQASGQLDEIGPQSDVYSLGATLYFVLTARRPFVASSLTDVLRAVRSGEFPAPRSVSASIPRPLEAICLKAMALKAGDRYASPAELAEDIQRWLGDNTVTAFQEPLADRIKRWVRRNQMLAVSLSVLLFVGLIASGVSTLLIGRAQQRTADALIKQTAARKEADLQRDLATEALFNNQNLSANLAFDRALGRGDSGDIPACLLWLVRALRYAPVENKDFRELVYANLGEWAGTAGRLQQVIRSNVSPRVMAVDSSGRWLYGGSSEDVLVWDLHGGEQIHELEFPAASEVEESGAHASRASRIRAIALAEERGLLAAGRGSSVQFWNLKGHRVEGQLLNFEAAVSVLRFNDQQTQLAVGLADGTAHLVDVESRELVGKVDHEGPIRVILFQPQGDAMLTTGNEFIRFWRPVGGGASHPKLKTIETSGPVISADWSADGRNVVTAHFGVNEINIWEASSGDRIAQLGDFNDLVNYVAFNSDGSRIAAAQENFEAWVWSLDAKSRVGEPFIHDKYVQYLKFCDDDKCLITATTSSVVRRWDLEEMERNKVLFDLGRANLDTVGAALGRQYATTPPDKLDLHPNGGVLLSGSMKGIAQRFALDGSPVGGPLDFEEPIARVLYSPDGELAVLTGFRGSVRVYRPDGWEQVGKTIGAEGAVLGIEFLEKDEIVTASMSGQIQVWNYRTGEPLGSPMVSRYPAGRLSWSRAKNQIAVGSFQNPITAWGLSKTEEKYTIDLGNPSLCTSFRSDGEQLAIGLQGLDAVIVDADSGQSVASLRHGGAIRALQWFADDRRLATGSFDRGIRLWHIPTQKRIGPVRKHASRVSYMRMANDESTVVSVDYDSYVYRWAIEEPVAASQSALRDWVEMRTGFRLADGNAVEALAPDEWAERKSRLAASKEQLP